MRVAVIGAGLAGLAAGCELADRGHQVTLYERRPWAGGKTYSFVERETQEAVDNGQHIFMPCMTAYVGFLRRLGTLRLTRRQRRMRVPVFDAAGRRSDLWAAALRPPFHLAAAFTVYRHVAPADKLRIARALIAIMRTNAEQRDACNAETFAAWLRRHGQSATAIRDFWDLIVVPTLNARSAEASAAQALFVFQEGFLKSSDATAIGIPAVGLSQLHVEPALRYIKRRGGTIRPGCGVTGIELGAGGVTGIALTSGEHVSADAYIAALPPADLLQLLPAAARTEAPFARLDRFRTAPIVNLHLWFDGPVADFDFAAFVGSDLQWIFNRSRIGGADPARGEHLVVSLSAAGRYVGLGKRELEELFLPQLQRALPRARKLRRSVVIKEPDATFLAAPGLVRPRNETPFANLFLAGAYTATGWPATMESAVRSGTAAAAALQRWAGR
jgi:squalene-associated FAD-dependent desaturase